MTDHEIFEWVAMLGSTREAQRAGIRELLRHQRGDEMTQVDQGICRRALVLLDARCSRRVEEPRLEAVS